VGGFVLWGGGGGGWHDIENVDSCKKE